MQTIRANKQQTVFDIAIQHTGDVEGAMDIAILNSIAADDEIAPDTDLIIPDVINRLVVNVYSRNRIIPSTAIFNQVK